MINRLSTQERKADTRNKIQLGGLVIKSRLSEFDKAVILGAMLEAVERLSNDEALLKMYKQKGQEAFKK